MQCDLGHAGGLGHWNRNSMPMSCQCLRLNDQHCSACSETISARMCKSLIVNTYNQSGAKVRPLYVAAPPPQKSRYTWSGDILRVKEKGQSSGIEDQSSLSHSVESCVLKRSRDGRPVRSEVPKSHASGRKDAPTRQRTTAASHLREAHPNNL